MTEETKKSLGMEESLRVASELRVEKAHYQRELRAIELTAYSGLLQAFRASGKPNSEKEGIIKTLREYFNISDERHNAEIRLLAFDNSLQLISKKLTGYDFTEEWAFQAQRVYVPLGPQQPFSIYKKVSRDSNGLIIRDPVPSKCYKNGENALDDSDLLSNSDSSSESELDFADNIQDEFQESCNGWESRSPKPVTIAVDPGTGNEEEVRKLEEEMKKTKSLVKKQELTSAKSPDITDAPRTPIKFYEDKANNRELKSAASKKPRGVKRKKEEFLTSIPLPTPPSVVSESSTKIAAKKLAEKSKNLMQTKKTTKEKIKLKIPPRRSDSNKIRESSEETSSADEGENGPMPLDESSRVMSPVFSEVIRTSVLSRGGKGFPKTRTKGDKRRNNMLNNSAPITKSGKFRSRAPNQKSGKLKASTTTSGSRRKSKLNEKIDYDEVLMEMGRNRSEKKRLSQVEGSDDPSRRIVLGNQLSEDCAVYANALPVNYIHDDMEQVTDGVFKRPLPPSRGPKPWEIKDAKLNHTVHQTANYYEDFVSDENTDGNDNRLRSEIEGSHSPRIVHISSPPQINVMNDSVSSTMPTKNNDPPSKKQRIKSPLIVNPNINSSTNKVPLPPPVFSTSLSTVSKKRNNSSLNNNNNNAKPISVVDSLNLHLPTSPTASSLAASSSNRRPGTASGGGCSMFSNSSALIAGARGTAPGILQQQRKAHPHILSNSKVLQRTFLPPLSSPTSNLGGNSVPIAGTPVTLSPPSNTISATPIVASAGHAVQITGTPIPVSAISNSTAPPQFETFTGTPPPGITLGPGMPLGHVGRSPANIIFVQKANGPAVGGGSTELPNNMIPIKTQPRAVILRRAQLPRQGNVMILDMQKNQLMAPGQAPPFLQTARVLNAPGELSLVNIQQSSSPIKVVPPSAMELMPNQTLSNVHSIHPSQQELTQADHMRSDDTVIQTPNPASFITVSTECPMPQISHVSSVVTNTSIEIGSSAVSQQDQMIASDDDNVVEGEGQDAQYAQIEAELLQMETGNFQEVVYEEEVTTEIVPLEDNETTQYIYTTESCEKSEEAYLTPQHSARSIQSSVSSSDTENDISGCFGTPENDTSNLSAVTKVLLSPTTESKLASEAISRAISLSKSTAKRLTLTPPISLSTAASLASSLTISNKSHIVGSETVVAENSNQISIVPQIFQGSATDLNPAAIVIEADHSSTNSVPSGKLQQGLGFSIRTDEIVQAQPNVQGNDNSS